MEASVLDALWEKFRVKFKWGYSHARACEHLGHTDPATDKQVRFLYVLSRKNPEIAHEMKLILSLYPLENADCETWPCTKGQAMFFISCFLGEKKPLYVALEEAILNGAYEL